MLGTKLFHHRTQSQELLSRRDGPLLLGLQPLRPLPALRLPCGLRRLQLGTKRFGFPLRLQLVAAFHLQQLREMHVPALDQSPRREMLGHETLADQVYVQTPRLSESDMPRRRSERGRDRRRPPVIRPTLLRILQINPLRLPGTLRNLRGRRGYRRALNAAHRPHSVILRGIRTHTVHVLRRRKRHPVTPSPTRGRFLPIFLTPRGRIGPQRGHAPPPVRPKHIPRPHHRNRLPRHVEIPRRRNKIPRRIARRKQRLPIRAQEIILRSSRNSHAPLAHFLPAAAERRLKHGRRRLFTLRFWIQIFSCFSLARVTYVRTTIKVLDSSSSMDIVRVQICHPRGDRITHHDRTG